MALDKIFILHLKVAIDNFLNLSSKAPQLPSERTNLDANHSITYHLLHNNSLRHRDLAIAAMISTINSSNLAVKLASGLLAKKAVKSLTIP